MSSGLKDLDTWVVKQNAPGTLVKLNIIHNKVVITILIIVENWFALENLVYGIKMSFRAWAPALSGLYLKKHESSREEVS